MIEKDRMMFCFQCEQTSGCAGCMGRAGVCGKTADVALLQDELTGALVELAYLVDDSDVSDEVWQLVVEALFATVTNVNFDADAIFELLERVHAQQARAMSESGGEGFQVVGDYDMNAVWEAPEDIRSLKSLILFGLRGMAAYAYHAFVLGYAKDDVNRFFIRALRAVGSGLGAGELLAIALELGEKNYAVMEMLDEANTETFGTPVPTEVSLTVERGPFIVVSGHDLYDLQQLLEQTRGLGINVYTHGEMLPAHGYPELRKYPHLKGHFGTAWQNQQKEFAGMPAPVLFTTNCLMPPRASYADRVYTTEVVSFPGLVHIDGERDFSPLIEQALELGGYPQDMPFTGINGGSSVTTGFAHGAVMSVADRLVEAVRSGQISRIFLVGGCDGARPGRNYYTEFVKQTPADSLVLTLACGKFRFNDLDLGTVAGLPRLMDMGQCNDAFSAVKVALALADAFDCSVNELPLSFVLSWYEQKAVCILLTLLHLGVRGIRLGPTLPAFISPSILEYLVERYDIAPITTPEADLQAILQG